MALDEARQIAEGIRSTLSLHTMTADKKTFAITASFGVAEYINGEGLTQALSRADAALYRAKANGRNRVEQATR
jgi:diguanylate cyclase (GGDEF)-like protein